MPAACPLAQDRNDYKAPAGMQTMRALRCPRCQTAVHVADNEQPQCMSCGFGRQIQQVSQNVQASQATSQEAPRRTGLVVAVVVVAALLVAGVAAASLYALGTFDDKPAPGAFSEEESRIRVEEALAALPGDMAEGGKLRIMTGTMAFQDEEFFGDMDGSFRLEWGTGGAMKATISMKQGPITIAFEIYCAAERTIMVFDDKAIEERVSEWGDCSEFKDAEGGLDEFVLTDIEEDGIEITSVTSHADGSITATLVNDTTTGHVKVDPQGRLLEMSMEEEEGEMEMAFVYGARQAIQLPTDAQRAPADIDGHGSWYEGVYEWEAFSWGPTAPLDEFEVRVMDGDTQVASFNLDGGPQSTGDIAFQFEDDGDGEFGGQDTFTITAPQEYDVVVWDLWADRDIEDGVEAPGAHWLLGGVALVGLAALRRRR